MIRKPRHGRESHDSLEGRPFFLFAGPCVIESESHALECARAIAAVASKHKIPFVYKSSYDKANRSSVKSFRGVGLEKGLAILAEVRRKVGVPVLTDVHLPEEAAEAGKVVDVLQVPAFLCRQTDLLVSCGETGKCVNIKKGQFLSPREMAGAVEKVRGTGNPNILLTERGTFFGYGRLVVDFSGFPISPSTAARRCSMQPIRSSSRARSATGRVAIARVCRSSRARRWRSASMGSSWKSTPIPIGRRATARIW